MVAKYRQKSLTVNDYSVLLRIVHEYCHVQLFVLPKSGKQTLARIPEISKHNLKSDFFYNSMEKSKKLL